MNVSGGVIAADRTNAGVANRGIAVQGTAGVEAIDNGGEITGDVEIGDAAGATSGDLFGFFDYETEPLDDDLIDEIARELEG